MLAIPILDGTSVEAANCKDQALVKKNFIKQGCDVLSPQGQEQKDFSYLYIFKTQWRCNNKPVPASLFSSRDWITDELKNKPLNLPSLLVGASESATHPDEFRASEIEATNTYAI
ncbi:hypothetical protein PCASD_22688 [Puccinia coronata f. sp. avenae]|uniref:Uncharacterized protein n=1 Tax=Puccinia coronata f. sp. avenae TaxID=200324 RepID=A0A2N5SBR0_9BASI|nr:hypothetical protein PCASD_22688 [Puccinia coronata f. sp. avenae]